MTPQEELVAVICSASFVMSVDLELYTFVHSPFCPDCLQVPFKMVIACLPSSALLCY